MIVLRILRIISEIISDILTDIRNNLRDPDEIQMFPIEIMRIHNWNLGTFGVILSFFSQILIILACIFQVVTCNFYEKL